MAWPRNVPPCHPQSTCSPPPGCPRGRLQPCIRISCLAAHRCRSPSHGPRPPPEKPHTKARTHTRAPTLAQSHWLGGWRRLPCCWPSAHDSLQGTFASHHFSASHHHRQPLSHQLPHDLLAKALLQPLRHLKPSGRAGRGRGRGGHGSSSSSRRGGAGRREVRRGCREVAWVRWGGSSKQRRHYIAVDANGLDQ